MGACTWTEVTLLQKRLGDPGRVKARKLRQMHRGPGTHPQVLGRGQPGCGRRRAGRDCGQRQLELWALLRRSLGGDVIIRRIRPTEPRAQGHRQEVLADARHCATF